MKEVTFIETVNVLAMCLVFVRAGIESTQFIINLL